MTRSQWRYCAKVGLAAALGYFLTYGNVNEYAIYSSFTAALVVGASLGEDLATSASRVKGTLVGMVAALVASTLFGPNALSIGFAVALTAALALTSGWGIPVARIGVTICIITLALYDEHALQYDLLRVGNTLIGIAVGLAVSFLVWPVRGPDELNRATSSVLTAATQLLDALERGERNIRPLQGKLHDALAAVVKAWRDTNREQIMGRRFVDHEKNTVAALRLGSDVLSYALGEPAGDVPALLRRRIEELAVLLSKR